MTIRIVTIKFDEHTEVFDDETLAAFLINKKVKKLKPHFFQQGHQAYWTMYVEYEPVLDEPKVATEELNETQKQLFLELRKWRKEEANEKKWQAILSAPTVNYWMLP